MFFAGTIWIIDLRMMGVAFRNVPFSRLNDRILPITMMAFGMMVFTGLVTFFGRQPATFYYHDIWFRLKMIFLVLASINIFWFHFMVQKNQAEWDAMAKPPNRVRISGAISMTCWILVIIFGRFIAYDWYKCDKLEPSSFLYTFAECANLYTDGENEGDLEEEELLDDDVDPAVARRLAEACSARRRPTRPRLRRKHRQPRRVRQILIRPHLLNRHLAREADPWISHTYFPGAADWIHNLGQNPALRLHRRPLRTVRRHPPAGPCPAWRLRDPHLPAPSRRRTG